MGTAARTRTGGSNCNQRFANNGGRWSRVPVLENIQKYSSVMRSTKGVLPTTTGLLASGHWESYRDRSPTSPRDQGGWFANATYNVVPHTYGLKFQLGLDVTLEV